MIKEILNLAFPDNIYCISCGSYIDKTRPYSLCNGCMKKLHWINGRTCNKCGKALQDTYAGNICYDCMAYDHIFDTGLSCVTYGLHERAIVLDFKYKDKPYIGHKLGEIMGDRLLCEDEIFDLVLPVPIHRKRRDERGYNQAEILAKKVAKKTGIEYNKSVLKRVKDTDVMRKLSSLERRENLKGAFKATEYARGKAVLLIDDIYTTGATADECAKVLKDAGAVSVSIMSFASAANINTIEEDD